MLNDKELDELIERLLSYEKDDDGFNQQIVAALRELRADGERALQQYQDRGAAIAALIAERDALLEQIKQLQSTHPGYKNPIPV